MTREELLKSPEYWMTNLQQDLYGIIYEYMLKNGKKKKDVAELLGVSKGYVSQMLNGDFDHKLSKLIEVSLAFGKVPKLDFIDIDQYLQKDAFYSPDNDCKVFKINATTGANSLMEKSASQSSQIGKETSIVAHKQEPYYQAKVK